MTRNRWERCRNLGRTSLIVEGKLSGGHLIPFDPSYMNKGVISGILVLVEFLSDDAVGISEGGLTENGGGGVGDRELPVEFQVVESLEKE